MVDTTSRWTLCHRSLTNDALVRSGRHATVTDTDGANTTTDIILLSDLFAFVFTEHLPKHGMMRDKCQVHILVERLAITGMGIALRIQNSSCSLTNLLGLVNFLVLRFVRKRFLIFAQPLRGRPNSVQVFHPIHIS